MVVIEFILLCFLFFIAYLYFIRDYILVRLKFRCLRCGECCKLKVKLTEGEIKKIKEFTGRKDFYEGIIMKRINGKCIFLECKDNKTYCRIENIKPKVCKDFPFKKGIFNLPKVDSRCKFYYGKLF